MSVCICSLFKQSSQLFNVPLRPKRTSFSMISKTLIHFPQISTVSNVIASLYRIFKRLLCSSFFFFFLKYLWICTYEHRSLQRYQGP